MFKTKDENKQRTELLVIVTPEITLPLRAGDPKPDIYFPRDFLVKLDPNDVKTGSKSGGKKN